MTLPPEKCKCGEAIYLERVSVRGTWETYFNFDGSDPETADLSNLKHGATPKTVECAKCNRRYLNPRYGWVLG
jgi:hypothetical protein